MSGKIKLPSIFLLFLILLPKTSLSEDPTRKARIIIDEAVVSIERIREENMPSPKSENALKKARGVLIIPSYYKVGIFLGGSYGDGVLLKRDKTGGFSDPAFYRMTSGSLGLQLGMQSSEVMFLILTSRGMQAVIDDKFKICANVGISVGPAGVGVEGATTTNIGRDIVAYSRNAGLFAGGGFEGSIISPRKDLNAAVYGVGDSNPNSIISRSSLVYAERLRNALTSEIYYSSPQVK